MQQNNEIPIWERKGYEFHTDDDKEIHTSQNERANTTQYQQTRRTNYHGRKTRNPIKYRRSGENRPDISYKTK